MGKKLSKWEREKADNAKRLAAKKRMVSKANAAVEELWQASDGTFKDGKKLFTELEREAIADASYHMRSVVGGWCNHKRR